ncbi:hypothetical protein DQ240_02715 [Blastococcus sp. TF02A-26]|nr:hypothetical protein DQ240_02715 [Blastococcus sp. TF02A-26]
MVCGLVRGGCGQQFQGGSLHWSPATGAQATHGAIRDAWAAQGWETGSLGYPTGAMTCAVSGDCEQRFQGGTLRWIAAQGRVQRTA